MIQQVCRSLANGSAISEKDSWLCCIERSLAIVTGDLPARVTSSLYTTGFGACGVPELGHGR
jgi:hypothetical protein